MSDVVDLGPLIAAGAAGNADPALAATLAASQPIVLLPVRVETRYAGAAGGGRELLVRIWPDQVHVDAHDPRLTAAEAEAGQQFWLADWRCGGDQERRRRAWQSLAERFDPARAGWIARATRPVNATARPADAVADTEAPRVLPTFGPVTLSEHASPPVARLLPAAWTATAYAGGQMVAVATGRPITADPAVGPDIDAPLVHPEVDGDDNHEVAAIDTAMHWLVDFATAEAIGMALRLQVDGPVDVLLVTGVHDGDPTAGADGLAALLDAQRFTAGLGIVDPGTLTNNTEGAPAGWSSAELGSLGVVDASADPAPTAPLARALGLADAHLPAGDDDGDDALVAAVTRSLWPATWGYWLTQFIGLGVAGLDADDCDWARDHAATFVRPGGPLPTLRVGRQPYGLLPTTALSRFQGDPRETGSAAIVAGLVATGWRPALGKAARVGRGDPAADLVDVFRLDARSDRVALRRALGSTFAANALNFLDQAVSTDAWRALAARTQSLTAATGLPVTVAGALLLYEPTAWPVELPLVGDDHAAALRDLLVADVDAVADAVDEVPASLLAALVRHGWLREHADAATKLIADVTVAPAHDAELFGFAGSTLGWSARRARPSATPPCGPGWRRPPIRRPPASRRSVPPCSLSPMRVPTCSHPASPTRSMPPPTGWTRGPRRWRPAASPSCGPRSPPGCWSAGTAGSSGLRRRRATRSPNRSRVNRCRCTGRSTTRDSCTPRRSTRPRSRRCCATLTSPTVAATTTRLPSRSRRSACDWRSASSTACEPAAASEPCSAISSSATCTSGASTPRSTTPARSRRCRGRSCCRSLHAGSTGSRSTSCGPTAKATPSTTSSTARRTRRCGARLPGCCAAWGWLSTRPPICCRPSRSITSCGAT